MSTPTPAPLAAHTIRIVFLGDAGIGKSNLITTYTSNYYTGQYIEGVEDTYMKIVKVIDGPSVELIIHDLGGSENHERLRQLFLGTQGKVDVFVLCFNLSDRKSLWSVATKWKDLANHVGRGVPIMVVGLRSDEGVHLVDELELRTAVEASAYRECSALKKVGVGEVFRMAIKIALVPMEEKQLAIPTGSKYKWIGGWNKRKEKRTKKA